ncbi:MAG TPA: 50S ribosomal protein L11 methyltransferase [Myxococcota bacterium]|nr:50S ribosomal protein L11 methyltransferase [Myxococcota bacterium]HQK51259.1 50S ribosomal protein L11 methyltransferase [Myxococcota bacterium]
MKRYVQMRVRVPVRVQDRVTDAWMARGALGVQEEHRGLTPTDGPVVSGNPAEWAGAALPNPDPEVTLTAWFEEPATPEGESLAIQGLLAGLSPHEAGPVQVEASWLEDQDWNAQWKASWQPVTVGRVRIVPTFIEAPGPWEGLILRLDPGMAFGTGTHVTTATCLEFLQEVLTPPRPIEVLDVGTGSGILALAALGLGARGALGVDLDPDALEEARRNARRNGLEDRLRLSSRPLAGDEGEFPLVLANLLAPVLVHLAAPLARVTAPGGHLVTSGVLEDQQPEVQAALSRQGIHPRAIRSREGWVTAIWVRPDPPP